MLSPRYVLMVSSLVLFASIFLYFGLMQMGILPLKYAVAASILPLSTGILILTNLDAHLVPAGMKMINIMGMSATTSVLSGIVPAVYFLSNPVHINLLK